jgi:cation diffusion facilitator family transporter
VNRNHNRHTGDGTVVPGAHHHGVFQGDEEQSREDQSRGEHHSCPLEDFDSHDHGVSHHHDHEARGGLHGFVASVLRPHSHDAVNSVDTALETSREGMTALKISFAILAATASVQVAIVVISGSVALLADTIHNFADALTAIPLGLAFWLGRRPANRRYTYGYGRAEDLAGVFVVVTVAASAAVAGWEAVDRLIHPQQVSHIGWVIVAGLIGFAGNELVAHYRIRVGRKIGSAALEADGYHARTDGVTSLGVVAGAVGVALGWQAADPIFGLAITVVILLVVKNAVRDIYRRLMDGVDPALVGQIGTVLGEASGIETVDAIRVRWIGHELHAEAEVTSDADLPLSAAHAIAEDARHQLLHKVRRLTSVTIHTSPSSLHGIDPHAMTAHHFTPSLPKPGPDSHPVT